ncbi:MAG: methylenetetrahydrofolate reductase [NAD(P)H] [Pseudomonadota bacterium]
MKNISFEFFPTKTTEGSRKLALVRDRLGISKPNYFSVTYGAGGTTQQGTLDTVLSIKQAGFEVAPHLSCIGSSREHLREILKTYQSHKINRIVALRGDLPSGSHDLGELHYANELVEFIRKETGDYFHIEVAAYPEFHPQAINSKTDFQHFERKMKAGADSAITQYFFNLDAYLFFIDDCIKAGIDQAIVPGIMPIVNFTRLSSFSSMCGAEIPAWIRKRLEQMGDDTDSIKSFGLDVISQLCEKLIKSGAPGLHFYTLNQSETTLKILDNIG